MNADQLLDHYEQIADARDVVPRLRRFVLDLAVRGKLVEQDPAEEPASKLLKRIAAEKAQMVKAGEIGKPKQSDPVGIGDEPFELPRSWAWVRLAGILTKLTDGTHHSPPNGPAGDFLYITAKNIKNEGVLLDNVTYVSDKVHSGIYSRCNPERGDILYIKDGATTGIVTVNNLDQPFSMLSSVALLKLPHCLFNRLIVEFLRSPFFYEQMRSFMKGAAITRVTLKRMGPALFPLPPLAEQHRIVARVDELMALCDQLEAAREKREATRDRLAAASLARLNRPDPDPAVFADDARFAMENLAPLTTRPDQVKALRQTILNLAVRGKLVEQDPGDEPVSELLKRIATEKADLISAGEIRKEKPLPLLSDVEKPFDVPDGWAWIRLGTLSQFVTSGSRDWAKHYSKEGAIFVRMGNLSKGNYRLRLNQIQRVKPPADGEGTRTRLNTGDILISITGDVGMLGLIPENFGEAYINQHTAMVRPMGEMRGRYLAELFRSPFAQGQFCEPQRGIKNSFRLTDVTQFVVPLPPLAEQHRIVARVDELMALCDKLEENLDQSTTTRDRLLEVLLHGALEPIPFAEKAA